MKGSTPSLATMFSIVRSGDMVFALDEIDDIGMVDVEDYHHGSPASFASGLDDAGKGVEKLSGALALPPPPPLRSSNEGLSWTHRKRRLGGDSGRARFRVYPLRVEFCGTGHKALCGLPSPARRHEYRDGLRQ